MLPRICFQDAIKGLAGLLAPRTRPRGLMGLASPLGPTLSNLNLDIQLEVTWEDAYSVLARAMTLGVMPPGEALAAWTQ